MNDVPEPLLAAVLEKLSLPETIHPTYEGLQQLFVSWCRNTGSDTVGIALRSSADPSLIGFPAKQFFQRWIEYGISDLCFANSEALLALLKHFGFEAKRAFGSTGSRSTHGSLIVLLDGNSYLVDPTFLAEEPLLLAEGRRTTAGAGPLRIWADTDGTVKWQMPQSRFQALFRIENDDCPFEVFQAGDLSFDNTHPLRRLLKDKIFVRRNIDGTVLTYDNGAVIKKTAGEVEIRKIDADQTRAMLVDVFNISPKAVAMIPGGFFPKQ